jgi:hypothetical protein
MHNLPHSKRKSCNKIKTNSSMRRSHRETTSIGAAQTILKKAAPSTLYKCEFRLQYFFVFFLLISCLYRPVSRWECYYMYTHDALCILHYYALILNSDENHIKSRKMKPMTTEKARECYCMYTHDALCIINPALLHN